MAIQSEFIEKKKLSTGYPLSLSFLHHGRLFIGVLLDHRGSVVSRGCMHHSHGLVGGLVVAVFHLSLLLGSHLEGYE